MEWAGGEGEDRVHLPHRAQGRTRRREETGEGAGGEVERDAGIVCGSRCRITQNEIRNEGGRTLPATEDAQHRKDASAPSLRSKQKLKRKEVSPCSTLIFSYSSHP